MDHGGPYVEQRHLIYFAAFLTKGHPTLKLALTSERWKKTSEWSEMLNMIYHTFQVCTKIVLKPARDSPDPVTSDNTEIYDSLVDDVADSPDEDDDYKDEGYQGSAPDQGSTAGDDCVADESADDNRQPVVTRIDFGVEYVDRINNTVFIGSTDYFGNSPGDCNSTNYEDWFPTIQEADVISDARDAEFCLHLFNEDDSSSAGERERYKSKSVTAPYHRQHVILNSQSNSGAVVGGLQ